MRYYKYKHFKIFSAGENSPNNLVNHYQSENHDISSGFLMCILSLLSSNITIVGMLVIFSPY